MVSTHPSNAIKRPAQVVLDTKQKRRTPAQVKADNAHIQKANEEKEEMTQKGIQQVAAAQEKLALQETNTLTPKKPCTRPIQHGKTTTANVPSKAGPANLSSSVPDGGSCLAGQGMMVDKPQVGDDDCDNDPGAMQGKRKCVQKTVHRNAVNAAHAVLASPSVTDGKSDVKLHDLIGKGRTPMYVL
jgi:hypothetical protein